MDREAEIRKIAYHMWELEGRPEGHSMEYWLMAESIWEINHRQESEGKENSANSPSDSKESEKKYE